MPFYVSQRDQQKAGAKLQKEGETAEEGKEGHWSAYTSS